MSTDIDYYKNLWTTTQGKGAQFFKNVDFNIAAYQYQEKVFRAYLHDMILKQDIHSVLELGVGNGRMTKIMLEEFPNIKQYECLDIKVDRIKIRQTLEPIKDIVNETHLVVHDPIDITKKIDDWILYDKEIFDKKYDIIFASEVFMHIKPEDIDYVISRLNKIGKQIINIDWTFNPDPNAGWYFIHDYEALYERYGARRIARVDMKRIQQSLFHYRWD